MLNLKKFLLASPTKGEKLKQKINKLPHPALRLTPKTKRDDLAKREDKSKNKLLLSLLESQAKFSNQYRGIQVKISGRIRGSLRTKKLWHSHGRISTQTIRSSVNSHKKQIFTKWGTWGSTIFISRSS